ncbi:protein transport protein SEC23 [Strigomonas culicis]|uniref:Protein transport protein SEC23 n=1 Tax=Strigomonas culicis TaxID=28005 RepID=S9UAG8_9TRYP|nr:protein transport protein SEC23 [Strigomonas culicis]|eukprot:EPY27777.1 protein transport protein SEC23 [Strigomonas culicis]
MVIPLGCMYTPLAAPCVELHHEPVACRACGGIYNPYTVADTRLQTATCPFCAQRGGQHPHMAAYGQQLPPELCAGNETIEYVTPAPQRQPPTFVFVVDTCIDTESEIDGLKEFLLLAMQKLPEYANVAFVTFGATVQLHEITGATAYARAFVLRGANTTAEELLKMVPQLKLCVAPWAACRDHMAAIVHNLVRDLWPVPKGHRPLRCTGAALSAAASLLQNVSPNTGSCILTFLSGVCTTGPGIVVDTDREKMIRSHADIRDGTSAASNWSASNAFFDKLMQRIVHQGHSLSVFTASLDQMGVAEMKSCIQASGGVVLSSESWLHEPFRISLEQFFARREDGALQMALNATMDVITSPTWKVLGVIGQCVGTGKKSTSVADYEIGLGGTCQWTTCMLDRHSSFAVYFDTAPAPPSLGPTQMRYVQIITRYEIGAETRTRVSTLTVEQRDGLAPAQMGAAFDQEAAAVLLARQAVHKTDSTPLFDVLRWLDRTVVRLVSRFGSYTPNVPTSLQLPECFVYFPAFMYHLRRSGYLHVFNYSPDESTILRLQLLKSSVPDSIIQIQPTLYSYSLDAAPVPVPLDSTAVKPDNVLLLDTFFEVLIHYGATIAEWKRAGYAEQEDYAYFREFLEVPLQDAQALAASRYPTPRLIDVCQNDPDSRILYNRINPSKSYADADAQAYGSHEGELVYTDDASLQVFMGHLKKLAVAQ